MGRGGVAVATVMGTVQVQKSVQCCLQLCSKQVGPGGVAISTPVEGGSAGNGGIAIAGAQGVAIVFALIESMRGTNYSTQTKTW